MWLGGPSIAFIVSHIAVAAVAVSPLGTQILARMVAQPQAKKDVARRSFWGVEL